MTKRHLIITGVAVLLASAVGLRAQATTSKVTEAAGNAKVTQEQITGEVVLVEGNWLLVKLQPSGQYRYFDIPPGRQFIIDGTAKLISDLRPGTVLRATAITTTQPIVVRTTTVTNGTVWYTSGNYVILTLPSGENREVHRAPDVPVRCGRQAGRSHRPEEGHEGLGGKSHRRTPDSHFDQDGYRRQSSEIGTRWSRRALSLRETRSIKVRCVGSLPITIRPAHRLRAGCRLRTAR